MTRYKKDIGQRGETEAILYLHKKGHEILHKNFYTHWGEIDIIAKKDNKIIFFEVKTRVGDKKGKPYESVTANKINRLRRPIQYFLLQNDYKDYKLSLDVISIILNDDLTVNVLKHFENVYSGWR